MDKYLIKEKTLYREGKNNVAKALIRINAPSLKTDNGGRYGNDYSSTVERVFVKAANQNKEAIKGIKINETLVKKFSGEDDLFSVFRIDKHFPILNGYDIEVETKKIKYLKYWELIQKSMLTVIRRNYDRKYFIRDYFWSSKRDFYIRARKEYYKSWKKHRKNIRK